MRVTLALIPPVMMSWRGKSWGGAGGWICARSAATAVTLLQALSGGDAQAEGQDGDSGELEFR
jgi:hypothetical protein